MPVKELKLEDLLKSSPKKEDDQDSIKEIAIIGGGVMGQGIAQTISSAGLDVLLI
jgi:glycerol-3-phosphate dehydrogenase